MCATVFRNGAKGDPSSQVSRAAALDLLAGIITANAAALSGFDALTVDHTRGRAGLSALQFTSSYDQKVIDLLSKSSGAPGVEIPLDRGHRRKILRQHSPLAARRRYVQEADLPTNMRTELPRPRTTTPIIVTYFRS
jgi:hypothetical protein